MNPKQTSEIAEDLDTMGKALQHHADTLRAPPPNHELFEQAFKAAAPFAAEPNRAARDTAKDVRILKLNNELCGWFEAASDLMEGSACSVTPLGLKECWAARERSFAAQIQASANERIPGIEPVSNIQREMQMLDLSSKLSALQSEVKRWSRAAGDLLASSEFMVDPGGLKSAVENERRIAREQLSHLRDQVSKWQDAARNLLDGTGRPATPSALFQAIAAERERARTDLKAAEHRAEQTSFHLADARNSLDAWQQAARRLFGAGSNYLPITVEQLVARKDAQIAQLTDRLNDWQCVVDGLDLGRVSPEKLREVLLDYRRRVVKQKATLDDQSNSIADLTQGMHSQGLELQEWRSIPKELGYYSEMGVKAFASEIEAKLNELAEWRLAATKCIQEPLTVNPANLVASVSRSAIEAELREWRKAAARFGGFSGRGTVSPSEFVAAVTNRQSELVEWRRAYQDCVHEGSLILPNEMRKHINEKRDEIANLCAEIRELKKTVPACGVATQIIIEARELLQLSGDEPFVPGMLREYQKDVDKRIQVLTQSLNDKTEWIGALHAERDKRALELKALQNENAKFVIQARRATNEWSIATREFWAALRSPEFAIAMADIFRTATSYGQGTEIIVEGVVGALSCIDQKARSNASAQVRAAE